MDEKWEIIEEYDTCKEIVVIYNFTVTFTFLDLKKSILYINRYD